MSQLSNTKIYTTMKKILLILTTLIGIYGCNTKSTNSDAEIAKAKQAAIDSMKQVNLISQQQKQIDSLKTVAETKAAKSNTAVVASSANAYTSSSRTTTPSTPVSYASAKKKKKMNNVAKGAIIGAGVGALTGAVVSKKKGQGAIVGGVLGAGAGAGVGAVIDKKQKQKENVIYFR